MGAGRARAKAGSSAKGPAHGRAGLARLEPGTGSTRPPPCGHARTARLRLARTPMRHASQASSPAPPCAPGRRGAGRRLGHMAGPAPSKSLKGVLAPNMRAPPRQPAGAAQAAFHGLRAPSAPRDTAPLRGGAWRAKRPRPRDPRQAIGRARRRALPRPPLAPMGCPAQALFPTRSRQKIRPVWPKFAVQARSMGPPGRHHGAERHKSERMQPRAR